VAAIDHEAAAVAFMRLVDPASEHALSIAGDAVADDIGVNTAADGNAPLTVGINIDAIDIDAAIVGIDINAIGIGAVVVGIDIDAIGINAVIVGIDIDAVAIDAVFFRKTLVTFATSPV